MNTSVDPTPTRRRGQIWILIAVFFAPLLLAFFLYYGMQGWRPGGSTNHGELIDPARPLPQVALTSAQGEAIPAGFLRGKWHVVFIGDGACDARCQEALTLMRQTRLALNDDMPRVQRVFLATDECCDNAWLAAEHPDLLTVRAAGQEAVTLLQSFPGAENGGSGRIYIVDPLGNLMMQYAADAPPKGLLEDLEKLLKLSHIG